MYQVIKKDPKVWVNISGTKKKWTIIFFHSITSTYYRSVFDKNFRSLPTLLFHGEENKQTSQKSNIMEHISPKWVRSKSPISIPNKVDFLIAAMMGNNLELKSCCWTGLMWSRIFLSRIVDPFLITSEMLIKRVLGTESHDLVIPSLTLA